MGKITHLSFSKMIVGLLMMLTPKLEAAFSNYNSILIGDLAAGMGGASAAVIGDASAASFYNPATLAQMEGASFSAAVGIYKKFDTTFGDAEDVTAAPLRVNQGFFRSLPASTGNVIRLGPYVFALSILVPDYDEYKGDLKKVNENATTLSYRDESLWVGGSVAKEISDSESFGLSAYYTARNFTRSLSDRTYTSATQATLYSEEKTLTENALVIVAGYYKKFSEQWSAGLSLRPPALKISSRANIFKSNTIVDTGTGSLQKPTDNFPDLPARVVIPGKLGLGVAYQPDPSWLWAFDVDIYEGVTYVDLEDENIGARISHKAVTNFSLGVQKTLIDWLKVRMGVFTNFSSHNDPDPTLAQLQEDKVDMLGFSANLVLVAGKKISYTFGGYYTGGRGRSIQRIQQNYQVVTKNQYVFTMLVGTSFYF